MGWLIKNTLNCTRKRNTGTLSLEMNLWLKLEDFGILLMQINILEEYSKPVDHKQEISKLQWTKSIERWMPLLLNMVKSIFLLVLTSMNSMKESTEKRRML